MAFQPYSSQGSPPGLVGSAGSQKSSMALEAYKKTRKLLKDTVLDMVHIKDSNTIVLLTQERRLREMATKRLTDVQEKLQELNDTVILRNRELQEHTDTIALLHRMLQSQQNSTKDFPCPQGISPKAAHIPQTLLFPSSSPRREVLKNIDQSDNVERMRNQVEALKLALDHRSSEEEFLHSKVKTLETALANLISKLEQTSLKQAEDASREIGNDGVPSEDEDVMFFANEQSLQLEEMRDLKKTIQKLVDERTSSDNLLKKQDKEIASLRVKLLEREQVMIAQTAKLNTLVAKHREEQMALQARLNFEQTASRVVHENQGNQIGMVGKELQRKGDEVVQLRAKVTDLTRQIGEMELEKKNMLTMETVAYHVSERVREHTIAFEDSKRKWDEAERRLNQDLNALQAELNETQQDLERMYAREALTQRAQQEFEKSIQDRLDCLATTLPQMKPTVVEVLVAAQENGVALSIVAKKDEEIKKLREDCSVLDDDVKGLTSTNEVLNNRIEALMKDIQRLSSQLEAVTKPKEEDDSLGTYKFLSPPEKKGRKKALSIAIKQPTEEHQSPQQRKKSVMSPLTRAKASKIVEPKNPKGKKEIKPIAKKDISPKAKKSVKLPEIGATSEVTPQDTPRDPETASSDVGALRAQGLESRSPLHFPSRRLRGGFEEGDDASCPTSPYMGPSHPLVNVIFDTPLVTGAAPEDVAPSPVVYLDRIVPRELGTEVDVQTSARLTFATTATEMTPRPEPVKPLPVDQSSYISPDTPTFFKPEGVNTSRLPTPSTDSTATNDIEESLPLEMVDAFTSFEPSIHTEVHGLVDIPPCEAEEVEQEEVEQEMEEEPSTPVSPEEEEGGEKEGGGLVLERPVHSRHKQTPSKNQARELTKVHELLSGPLPMRVRTLANSEVQTDNSAAIHGIHDTIATIQIPLTPLGVNRPEQRQSRGSTVENSEASTPLDRNPAPSLTTTESQQDESVAGQRISDLKTIETLSMAIQTDTVITPMGISTTQTEPPPIMRPVSAQCALLMGQRERDVLTLIIAEGETRSLHIAGETFERLDLLLVFHRFCVIIVESEAENFNDIDKARSALQSIQQSHRDAEETYETLSVAHTATMLMSPVTEAFEATSKNTRQAKSVKGPLTPLIATTSSEIPVFKDASLVSLVPSRLHF